MKIALQEASKKAEVRQEYAIGNSRANRQEQIESWRAEFESFFQQIASFQQGSDEDIFRTIAGCSARVSYIRSIVARSESPAFNNFRTREIDPLLNELQFQFKVWSRILSSKSLEWNIANS